MKKNKFGHIQNLILQYTSNQDYVSVNDIARNFQPIKRSKLVAIRSAIHNLTKKNIVTSGYVYNGETSRFELCAALPGKYIFEKRNVLKTEYFVKIIKKYVELIYNDYHNTDEIPYKLLYKCVSQEVSNEMNIKISDKRISTNFHRALKKLENNYLRLDYGHNNNNKIISAGKL